MKLNIRKVKNMLLGFNALASLLLNNKGDLKRKIDDGLLKAKGNRAVLTEIWVQLQTLFSLSKDYLNGNYADIDRKTVVTIIGALLYFISPIDIIPDFFLGLGFIDDAFVVGYVYTRLTEEIEKYNDWKSSKMITIHI